MRRRSHSSVLNQSRLLKQHLQPKKRNWSQSTCPNPKSVTACLPCQLTDRIQHPCFTETVSFTRLEAQSGFARFRNAVTIIQSHHGHGVDQSQVRLHGLPPLNRSMSGPSDSTSCYMSQVFASFARLHAVHRQTV